MDFSKLSSKTHTFDDLCLLPFSSGTTGLPKGVMITHSQIATNMKIINTPNPYESLTKPTTNSNQDVVQCVLPFFHIYGFACVLLSMLSVGCKLVTLPRFDPISYIASTAKHKINFLPLVPPILQVLTNDDRCTPQHLSHVRTILSAAAPIGHATIERFQETK